MRTNWPELTEFSGCCSLKCGIYVTAVFQLMSFICRSYFDLSEIEFWSYVMRRRDGHCECNITQSTLELEHKDRLILQIVNQHVIGILFRLVLIASIFILIYGMHSSKPTPLKVFLRINIPLCMINTLQLALTVYFYDFGWKILFVFSALIDAYQLVAVRSMYKLLTGKSMIYKESANQYHTTNGNSQETYAIGDHNNEQFNDSTVVNNINAASNDSMGNPTRVNQIVGRCESCNSVLRNEERAQAISPDNSVANTPVHRPNPPSYDDVAGVEGPKELNLKEEPTIFDPTQLVVRRHPLIEEPATDGGETSLSIGRPSGLDIEVGQKKLSLDRPVIYDQDQLNIGHSPIVEDRAIL